MMHEVALRVFPRGWQAGIAVIAAIAMVTMVACSRSDPERELRAAVARMAKAVEAREPGDLLEHLSDDFTRESAAFGKRDVQRLLAGVLLRNEKISVNAMVTAVEVAGERARTRVRVIATGGSGWLPERGQTWDFDVAWRLEKGTWRAFNAEWREGI